MLWIPCTECGGRFNPESLQEVLAHQHADLAMPVPDIKGTRVRRRGWVLGRLVLTLTFQADGAPLIDRGWGFLTDERPHLSRRRYRALVLRFPSSHTALVFGWLARG